jgi:hypothetical protein
MGVGIVDVGDIAAVIDVGDICHVHAVKIAR